MHLLPSYRTAPCAVFLIPPTGQTEAHAGSSQCMHMRRTNLPSRSWMTVKAVAFSSVSVRSGKLWTCLQAASQARQPTHLVMSMSNALLVSMSGLLALAQEDFVDDGLLHAGIDLA